ncbi:hypothetical protein [Streptomyces hoynatensis]|uniref:Uncharacterized protein n=1 Tax=Streptomyces hoynatensis TaxID=1141874 RepID=A0A3A9YXC2_9ACTN|nr:hypothetical protein [Streptomyces hoynatensis]RKN40772.1 hypothetical protein D7294_16920 [Streptomyces hoynatensis]
MSDVLPDYLVRYLEQRAQQRADAVNAVLARLTDREQALAREAAVMGYAQGRRHPEGEPHPTNSQVLAEVIDACLSFADLYPTINAVAAPEEPTITPAGLRERIAEALDDLYVRRDFDAEEFADAVLAVVERYTEQLAAGRETALAKAHEIEADRDRLADQLGHLERATIPELGRAIASQKAAKQRWHVRAEKAEAEVKRLTGLLAEYAEAAYKTAAGAADRFRDVLCEVLGHPTENPGDNALVAQLRAHHGKAGPEPTAWRDRLVGYEATRDQINAAALNDTDTPQ